MTNPTVLGAGGHSTGTAKQTWDTNTNYCANVGLGRCPMETGGITTESEASQIVRVPGVVSYLSWGVSEGFPIELSLSVRRGFSDGLVLTIPAGTTGLLTNSSDSLTVSAGDALDFAARANSTDPTVSYEGAFYCASARFDRTDTASAQLLATIGYDVTIPYGSTVFFNFLGILASPIDTVESDQQFYCLTPGAWRNMACHVSDNSLASSSLSTTVVSRKNGSNGVMAISITGTGYFEHTSTTFDSVSSGDLLDYQFSTTAVMGQLTMNWIGAHFFATDATQCMIGGTPMAGQPFVPGDADYYSSLFGGGNAANIITAQIRATGLVPYASKASKFTNHVSDSSGSATATFTLMKNGAATVLTITSKAGHSGYYMPISDTEVDFAQGDTCTNKITVAGSDGAVTWAGAALLLTASA